MFDQAFSFFFFKDSKQVIIMMKNDDILMRNVHGALFLQRAVFTYVEISLRIQETLLSQSALKQLFIYLLIYLCIVEIRTVKQLFVCFLFESASINDPSICKKHVPNVNSFVVVKHVHNFK